MKKALVLGGGGFIGNHMVSRLTNEGYWVRAVDLKKPDFCDSTADDFVITDLRSAEKVYSVLTTQGGSGFDEVYQFAADMGGAGYIFTGDHDACVMHNSATINLNVAEACKNIGIGRLFYSSSACMYPAHNQEDPNNPNCAEDSAYPAAPDSEYGWEKLFSERLYKAYYRNHGLNVRIARFHNIFGPLGTYDGGREKAPAAICRKVILSDNGKIDVWGSGNQTRSFLYIDECIEGVIRLMRSDVLDVLNIGSDEMVTINQLCGMVMDIAGKKLNINNIPGPEGVKGRNSDNRLIKEKLKWSPSSKLVSGLERTYNWIKQQYV